jgi:hypothetical protein
MIEAIKNYVERNKLLRGAILILTGIFSIQTIIVLIQVAMQPKVKESLFNPDPKPVVSLFTAYLASGRFIGLSLLLAFLFAWDLKNCWNEGTSLPRLGGILLLVAGATVLALIGIGTSASLLWASFWG